MKTHSLRHTSACTVSVKFKWVGDLHTKITKIYVLLTIAVRAPVTIGENTMFIDNYKWNIMYICKSEAVTIIVILVYTF